MIGKTALGVTGTAKEMRRQLSIALLLAIGLPLLGLGAFMTSAQTPTADACEKVTPTSGESAEECVGIGMFDIYFNPNLVTIPSDTGVRVVLDNHGVIQHNFSITDHENSGLKNLNIDVTVAPGQTGETTINAPEGEYYFFCNEPGHEAAGMRGYITVKKDAGITTAEATVTPRAG